MVITVLTKPATEDTLLDPVNPYAETKLMGERMIYWMANRYDWKYVIFRYFNVAGAEMDASNGLRVKNPTHIIPNINKTALGQNDSLKIFGDDYDTRGWFMYSRLHSCLGPCTGSC